MLGLLLLQVLASCLWLGHSEVVNSFASCPQFFYSGSPPNDALNPKNPAWICQRYKNLHRYATLYDRDRRIPVYSAYKYQPVSSKKMDVPWFVEPQLVDKTVNLKEMETDSALIEKETFTLEQIKASQAVPADYKDLNGLNPDYLCPSGHQDGIDSKTATFTLTNVVPQGSSLNKGQWAVYESATMIKKSKGCANTYVITGVVSGNTDISSGTVNVPSYIWSAACCEIKKKKMKAWGAIAGNHENKVEELSLGKLEKRLSDLYGGTVTLFDKACPRK